MREVKKKIASKRVLVFGTFDIFHKGHENFLYQARKFGGLLTVVVARDKTVKKVKGNLPKNCEKYRLEKIAGSKKVDKAILGNLGDKYAVIKKINPDIICVGYDQKAFVDSLKEKLVALGLKNVRMIRLKPYRPKIYKSSLIHDAHST